MGEGSALAALHLLLKNPLQRAVEDPCTRAWLASLTATAGYAQHCRSEVVIRRAHAISRPPAPTIGAAHQAPACQDAENNLVGVERVARSRAPIPPVRRISSPLTAYELLRIERRPTESLYDFVVHFRRAVERSPHINEATIIMTFRRNVHHQTLNGVLSWETISTAAELWWIPFYHALHDLTGSTSEGRANAA